MEKAIRGGVGYLLLGQPTLSSLVARALATKGDQPQLVEGRYELGITALDLTEMEYRFLRRSPTWEAGAVQAAVAAQFPIFAAGFQFNSPRVMAVIEEFTLNNQDVAAQTYRFGISYAGVGGVAQNTVAWQCDDRFGAPQPRGALTIGMGTNAADPAGANFSQIRLPANSCFTVRGPWVLSGNQNAVFQAAFLITGGNVNTAFGARLRWYEREPLASEL
jgi:hypothetical protein